ncbi:hypothetical protein [Secundilactobacillus odoratitofui]|uniref:hypothetical protein n=1 Tax=Secundilactobacillus odoratitofui TaxID=480930 RepID=UPI002092E391|nr:hypothetical protein [Secundilactobacillus odoratitofui]
MPVFLLNAIASIPELLLWLILPAKYQKPSPDNTDDLTSACFVVVGSFLKLACSFDFVDDLLPQAVKKNR